MVEGAFELGCQGFFVPQARPLRPSLPLDVDAMILPIHWNKSIMGKRLLDKRLLDKRLLGDSLNGKERAGVSGGGDCVRKVGG